MKYLLSILLLTLACLSAKAQMTLEHTYTNTGSFQVVRLEDEGDKYMIFDTLMDKVVFYNPDHSIWKSVAVNHPARRWPALTFAATKLYNLDSKVEFGFWYYETTTTTPYTTIFYACVANEDGTIVQKIKDVYYPTPIKVDGKWKIQCYDAFANAYKYHIYSVPGSMPQQTTGMKPDATSEGSSTNLYPNPMDNAATLAYSLPAGVYEGAIHIYNAAGQQVRSYNISSQFSNILVSRGELPPGHYTYKVTAQNTAPVSRMFIIQ